jgi:hypothetical protein
MVWSIEAELAPETFRSKSDEVELFSGAFLRQFCRILITTWHVKVVKLVVL